MAALPKSGISLVADNAAIFIKQLSVAEASIESFRKAAARQTPFAGPDTKSAVGAFNALVEQAAQAGTKAGAGLSGGFESGLSPLQTVVRGFFLGLGDIAANAFVGAVSKAKDIAWDSLVNASEFEQAIANISSLADGGVAVAGAVGDALQSVAVDPNLLVDTKGASTAFQALEKQGVATQDSLDGVLRSTVLLQNAAGTTAGDVGELGTAAEVVGQGMALFGLGADQAGALVDTFAAITTNSKFTLGDLNYTLANSAGAIQALGLSFNDIGAVAIATGSSFSSARTQATGLESLLQSLSAPSDKATDALRLLGVSAYDSTGEFVGLVGLQDQLQESFQRGEYTTQAFQKLLFEGFGDAGSQMAVALAKGEDLTAAMETLGNTSAQAIANIKVDTAAAALDNLAGIAGDLGRRLAQPFVDELAPAILATSELLGSLAGTFDYVGQSLAAALSPVIAAITAQFGTLAQTIASLTGISIAIPTAPTIGPAVGPQAAPQAGPQAAPSSAYATGSEASGNRKDISVANAELDAAKSSAKASKGFSSALSQLDDILSSSVSALDVNLSNEGLYEDKPDEKLRQLRAYVKNGSEQYAGVADDYRTALERIGVKPAEDAETFLAQVEELQASKAIFADPANIALLIDEEAVKREVEMKELAKKGAENIALAFGSYVANLVDATSSGLTGGTAAAAPAATPAPPTFVDPYELYVKPVQDAQAAQAKTVATNQKGAFDGLFQQFDVLNEKFGAVTLLFSGFNGLLETLNGVVTGQDFTAAGVAVSGTLTTVLGALTQITELADIGATTENLSTFTQTILDSAGNFADGIDGEAVAESASTLLTTITGQLSTAVDSADLTGIATSYTNYVVKASGLLVEAIHGFDFAGVGLSLGTLISRVANQLIGALQDPTVAANLGESAGNFATTAIGALKGAFTTLNGALATADENTDAGDITKGISGLVVTIVSRFTSAISEAKLDDLGVEVTGMVGHVANLFLEAVQGIQYDAIGTAIGEMVGTVVNKFTELISDPQVGIDIGTAVGDFTSGIITAVQGAFTALSSALTGADDTIDLTALTGAIDGVVQGFVAGFVASITRNFTNQETGALEITVPTIGVLPLTPVDLSTLVSFTGELPAPVEVDKATVISYINELPPEFQVEKDKLVSYINELPPGKEIDQAALVSYINELPGATEVDKAKLINYVNALPEPTEVDKSKLVQVTGALPDAVTIDLSSLVSVTGSAEDGGSEGAGGFAPLTAVLDSLAPALTGVSIGIGLVDVAFQKAAEPGSGFDQLTQLITGTIDTITASVSDVDVAAIGGAINEVILSITGLFVTLSEIPDLGPITESIGGFVTSLLNLGTGLTGSIDGEQVGADFSTVASNIIARLAEGISAVPLDEIGVAAANLVGALAGTFRDALTVDNLSGVGESIGGLVTDIINKLTSTLGDPQFGATLGQAFGDFVAGIVQGAAGLIQGLGAGVDSEAVAGIGDALYTFVTSFVGGIADSLKTVEWGSVGQAIYDGISGAIGTLFSGAESLADNLFGLGFTGGQAIGNALGFGGDQSPADGEQAQGSNVFSQIATKLSTDLATAFATDMLYTADISGAISAAGGNLRGDIGSSFAKEALYPESTASGLKSIGTSIAEAIAGLFDSVINAYNSIAENLLLPTIGKPKAQTPEEAKVADDLQKNLATKDDVINLANATQNSGQITPILQLGQTANEVMNPTLGNTTTNNITYNTADYQGANAFDGSTTIPVVVQNAEAIAPAATTNADGTLTAAGQEQAVSNLGALFGGLSANLGEAIAPAISQAAGSIAGTLSALPQPVGPPTAGYNPLSSAPVVEVKPVELSENAATLLNNYATSQVQAAAQGQDTAAPLPTAEELLVGVTSSLPAYFYQAPAASPEINLASSGLVGLSTGDAGIGGEYGPPTAALTAALDANTSALQGQPADQVQAATGFGEVAPLEFGPDTQKILETQTEAIIHSANVQESTAGSGEAGASANPKTAAELKQLQTTIPTTGQKFTVTLGATATTAGTANEKLGDLSESSTEAAAAIEDQGDAADNVTGSFNILLSKSDATAESVSDLNDALSGDGLTGGITDLTDALDQAVDDINAALTKLDGDNGTTSPTQPTKPAGTTGASAAGGPATGRTLVGEEGPELVYNKALRQSWMVGENGPEFTDLPSGSYVYPNSQTKSILARSGGSSDKLWASAAAGLTPNLDPIFTDPLPGSGLPGTGTIDEGDDGIQKDEPATVAETGSLFDNPFVQALFRQQGQGSAPIKDAIGQAVAQTGNGFNIDELVNIFNRPLFGSRYSPASTVVNITVNSNVDNSVNTKNYNLATSTQQRTESVLDSFKLLQATFG